MALLWVDGFLGFYSFMSCINMVSIRLKLIFIMILQGVFQDMISLIYPLLFTFTLNVMNSNILCVIIL